MTNQPHKINHKQSDINQRLELVIKAAGVGIWDWEIQTGELTFNARWAEIMGYTVEELQPTKFETWANNLHPDDYKKASALLKQHFDGVIDHYEIEARLKHKSGHYVWVLASGELVEWDAAGQPKRMIGTHLDITERKKNEDRLMVISQLLNESQKVAQVGGWELDLITGNLDWTDETYRIHDTCPEEFNPTVDAGVGYFLPESKEIISKALDSAINNCIGYDLELETYTTKGRKIDVRTTCSVTQKDGKPIRLTGIFQDISDFKIKEIELEGHKKNLEQLVKKRTNQLEVAKEKAETKSLKLKQSLQELKETQSKLIEAQKMASLGRLVKGVAHELNTPIGICVTATSHACNETEVLRKHFDQGDLSRDKLIKYLDAQTMSNEMIQTSLNRAANLVNSFKSADVEESSNATSTFLLKDILELTFNMYRDKYKGIKVELLCDDKLAITSYLNVFSQVIESMLLNSYQHGFENQNNGLIKIEVGVDGSHLCLTYSDNGKGMTDEAVKNIFEPFYTTKRGSGGTGLGMHIVYNLVTQKLKGDINCDSKEDEGTTIIIKVPNIIS